MKKGKNFMTNGELINFLAKNNDLTYNHTKSIEELNELATVLGQKINKTGQSKEPPDQDIIDEIGDVQIRLQILKELYGEELVNQRIQFKMDKFKKYIENDSFTGRV